MSTTTRTETAAFLRHRWEMAGMGSNDEQVEKAARAEAERRYITGGGRYVAGEGIDAFVAGVTWFRARQGDFEHAAGVAALHPEPAQVSAERTPNDLPCAGCGYSGPDPDCPQHGICAGYGHPCHCGEYDRAVTTPTDGGAS